MPIYLPIFTVKKMRVLITGATGLVGTAIIKLCEEENIKVNYLTRSKDKIETSENYRGFLWNPAKKEIDEKCLEDVDKIINLAGASVSKRWTSSYKKTILNSRLDSVNTLYQLLSKKEHEVGQIVSASAIGIYPDSLQKLYHEDEPEIADNFLGEVVDKWEKAVDQFAQLGLEVAKIRIGVVLSDKGGALEKIKEPIENYVGAPLGRGKQWQSWIHIKDIAGIFVHAIKNNWDGVFNGVAPNPVTNKELTKAIATKLNKPLVLPKVPPFALKMLLGEMAVIVLSSQLVSNTKVDSTSYMYQFTHLNPALDDLL